jgi:NAD(P)-dependent dehydrogenase (short-subunit alcohol dehydrogenase family)
MKELRFDGQVAIVTGGGGGIGRAHCLALAACGAKVIVNGRKNSGRTLSEIVRDEIVSLGGEAIAVHGTIGEDADARALVKAAIEAYGRLDIVINNAGTPGQRTAVQQAPTETFHQEIAMHVVGALQLNRAAWPHMAAQQYGRILFTGSALAFGWYEGPAGYDVDYAAAKSSLFGATKQTAAAGQKLGIKVNLVLPAAYTPMVERTLGESEFALWMAKYMRAELVAAGAVYLVHSDCPVTGEAFTLAAGRMARVVFAAPYGYQSANLDAEQVRDNWTLICGNVGPDKRLPEMLEIAGQPDEFSMIMKMIGAEPVPA